MVSYGPGWSSIRFIGSIISCHYLPFIQDFKRTARVFHTSSDCNQSSKEWTGDDWVYRSSAGVGTMGTMRDDPVTSKTADKAGARIRPGSGFWAEIF